MTGRNITTLRPAPRVRTVVGTPDPREATPLALARALARRHRLTPTESEVLEAFVAGCERADLAEALGVSENTMRSHVRAVCRKLAVPHLEHVHRCLLRECVDWLARSEARGGRLSRASG